MASEIFDDMFDTLDDPELFGEAVTYTAPGGDPESVTGTWSDEDTEDLVDEDGATMPQRARFTVRVAVLAAPVRKAVVTRGGVDWAVVAVNDCTTAAHTLSLERSEILERRPGDTRKRR